MSLKTKVIVGNITNLSEARYCAGMGVDFLAFPSHRIDPKTFQEITGWVSGPAHILDLTESEVIPDELASYSADYVLVNIQQLNKISDPIQYPLIVFLKDLSEWLILKSEILSRKIPLSYLIIESKNMVAIDQLNTGFSVFVRYDRQHTIEAILESGMGGVMLLGSDEEKPGLKDYSELSEILEALEVSEE